MRFRDLFRFGLAFFSTLVIANCSSEGGTGTEGSIDLTLNPASGTAPQGGSVTSTGTLTRSGGFTGTVNFDVTGEPAGLTASVTNVVTTGTTTAATITVNVGSSVPAGPYALVVHATGSGVTEVTRTYNLSVTASGFSLSIAPAGIITLAQGGTDNSKTVTITRVSYTLPVTLAAEGLPNGVTATFAGNPVSGPTSVMTLTATGSATLTTSPVTVTVRGTGAASLVTPGSEANLEATTSFTLSVIPAGNFTLTTTPATTVNVTQGLNGGVTVNLPRTGGNTSSIALTETHTGALPAGMTLAFVPTSTTGNSATLNITTTGATPLGPTPIVIRGNTAGLGEQTANLSIVVTAPSSTNASIDFSGCAAALKPAWVASQNGTATWVVRTGVNDVYSFNIDAGKGGVTYVLLSNGGAASNVIVQYMSQAEWTAGPVIVCPPATQTGRTLTGTVGAMGANEIGQVSFGGSGASVTTASLGYTINNAGLGLRDLVIYTHPAATIGAISDRMLLDRDENPATTFGTRNMQMDPFAFIPTPALITITGAVMGETFMHSNTFYSRATCDAAILYLGISVSGTQFVAYGAQNPLAGERHAIFIQGISGLDRSRTLFEYVNALTNHNVAMGSPMPATTTTEIGTNYSILRNTYTAPGDLNGSYTWIYSQNTAAKTATVTGSPAYFGSTAIDMKIGEYTGLAGWIPTWAPTKGLAATGTSLASGFLGTGGICGGLLRSTTASVVVTF